MARLRVAQRFRGLTLAAGLAWALAGCGPSTHSSTFPAMNETGSVKLDAQPVDVVDFTGLVTGVEVFDPETPIAGIGGDRAIVRGQAMYIQWTGGACESRTRITFVPKDDGYELRIKADSTLAGMIGCPAVGVIRAIVIEIRESIEGKPLRTVFQYASLE